MYSKWKILAFCGMGIMFGMIGLVGMLGNTTEVIQESEVVPGGTYYNNDLNIPSKESVSKKASWYSEVVNVSIFANNPQLPLEVFLKTSNGNVMWSSKFIGELKDSIVVDPGKTYTITILNNGNESLKSGKFSFETAYFTDKDGNFVIAKTAQYLLIFVAVCIGASIFIIAQYNIHKIGEKWTL